MARAYYGRQNEMKVSAGALKGKVSAVVIFTEKFVRDSICRNTEYLRKSVEDEKGIYFPSSGYEEKPTLTH